jgi:FixJ family two-component response regulator
MSLSKAPALSTAPTVFVVDDDPSVRKALARLLTSVGLSVETFAGASELFARAPRGEHGCLLLDVQMPQTTGLELQQQLEGADIRLPVIFVTAHADVPITVRAMKAGAIEVLTKPFHDGALLAAVQQAIAMDDARRRERYERETISERFQTLSPRERMVMTHVVTGKLNKQIAWLMGTSEKTVKAQRARVMMKMTATSLPELVRMADRIGLPADFSDSPTEV